MKAIILPAALILGSISPYGECAELVLPLTSKHITVVPAPQGYRYAPLNEVNPGIGYIGNKGLTAGMYYNSYKDTTLYAGYTSKCWILNCSYLVASGYSKLFEYAKLPNPTKGIIPMVLVGYDIDITKGLQASLNYVVQPSTTQVFGLVLKYSL